jgi:hypothetical protein
MVTWDSGTLDEERLWQRTVQTSIDSGRKSASIWRARYRLVPGGRF